MYAQTTGGRRESCSAAEPQESSKQLNAELMGLLRTIRHHHLTRAEVKLMKSWNRRFSHLLAEAS
jgi:hypothetical protein